MAPFSAATRKTLAFFVGTTALAQLGWALGPASIMRRELANACGADEDACAADETCLACAEIFLAKEPCRGPDYNYDTASCDEIVEGMCCAIQVAEDTGAGCETNELFLALYGGWCICESYRYGRKWCSRFCGTAVGSLSLGSTWGEGRQVSRSYLSTTTACALPNFCLGLLAFHRLWLPHEILRAFATG